jgi:Ni/Co efflux regulator RcnB
MRKILITLLLASAAASPALAGPNDQADRQQARAERQQAHAERQQVRNEARAERQQAAQREFQPQGRPQRQAFEGRQFQPEPGQAQANIEAMRAARDARREGFAAQQDARMQQYQQRQQEMRDARDFRQSARPNPNVMRDRHPLVVSNTPRFGTQPPMRAESHVQWNTHWRDDDRYDWRRYRDRDRDRFHLAFYIDPFGWGYQPFSIGYRMWPAYYGNQYWIDPGYYGLPYPPPGAVWIRYFNDALLIDTYTGTVIDVIPGFFW